MKTSFNRGVDVQALAAQTKGLQKEVLLVLKYSVGRERAMSRNDLIGYLRRNPLWADVDERLVREAIHELRQSGVALICSTGGVGGGYWFAKDWDEVDEFIAREIEPRAYGLLETKRAMLATAGRQFGPKPVVKQTTLF